MFEAVCKRGLCKAGLLVGIACGAPMLAAQANPLTDLANAGVEFGKKIGDKVTGKGGSDSAEPENVSGKNKQTTHDLPADFMKELTKYVGDKEARKIRTTFLGNRGPMIQTSFGDGNFQIKGDGLSASGPAQNYSHKFNGYTCSGTRFPSAAGFWSSLSIQCAKS